MYSDTLSMEHPMFSLATKADMRELEYRNGNNVLKIIPSSLGLATVFDKDILIFCISQLVYKKSQGENIGKVLRFPARELMIATGRPTGGTEYKRLENSLYRLMGTSFHIHKYNETFPFNLLETGSGFVSQSDRVDYCEVVISDWILEAVERNEVVSISRDYFNIRRPLTRRLYEIARIHCGSKSHWQIGLKRLQEKTGSFAPSNKFRYNIRQVSLNGGIPFYSAHVSSDDTVTFENEGHPENTEYRPLYHTVYKTVNNINGKIYIGQHSTPNLGDGYLGSGTELKKDIMKYGRENFTKEILELFDTRELAEYKEKSLLTPEFVSRCDVYNLQVGSKSC